ncbi:hypothetical protein RJ641_015209 [Dillenia turbinata]|uniref:Uncharacterized protein n=1 Tax=Dillenia turbinata TaxID=194707 RepID=A0AAN8Z0V4_9MAGN
MVNKAWRIIPRPLIETVLNNHVQHHRVPQPLILHGPRGAGKTTLLLNRLLPYWNKPPHQTTYIDFAESITDHHPLHNNSFPWYSWSICEQKPSLSTLKSQLELGLEQMTEKAIKLGLIGSTQIFNCLNKWHGVSTALRRVTNCSDTVRVNDMWEKAVRVNIESVRLNATESDGVLGEEREYYREAMAALRVAKEVIRMKEGWRENAVKELNQRGGFSRSLANSSTDWPCLLLELLSQAAEVGHFQPKLVLNNIDVLQTAILTDDTTVCASMYHDSLLWRIIRLGANERCLPVILVTSDRQVLVFSIMMMNLICKFGLPAIIPTEHILILAFQMYSSPVSWDWLVPVQYFGLTPQQAKMHLVNDYFSNSEWTVIAEVLGSNARHLFELYALKQSNYCQKVMENKASSFEDIIDAYLAHLQVTVVNPAMERALSFLQKFAVDVQSGRISKDRLQFGTPWRHPPRTDEPALCYEWAKIQLLDFVQSLINAEFGCRLKVNYLADWSLEIFDDPSAIALIEVGLLYVQRDPSFLRPVSRAIQRCLVRWLVQERMQMNSWGSLKYKWQRVIRGRSYRHLMLEAGFK